MDGHLAIDPLELSWQLIVRVLDDRIGQMENKFEIVIWNPNAEPIFGPGGPGFFGVFFRRDVTENYQITYEYGTLTVEPRPVDIQTVSARWHYDGKSHSGTNYEDITLSTRKQEGFVSGHHLQVRKSTQITDIGETDNIFASYRVVDNAGKDVSSCYDIHFTWGTLKILPIPLTLTPVYREKVYDGTPLYATGVEYSGGLLSGHILIAQARGSQLEAGTSLSQVDEASVKIMWGNRDMTSKYKISYRQNVVKVLPRPITVETVSHNWVYDGKIHSDPRYEITSEYRLVAGHSLSCWDWASITNPGQVDRGSCSNPAAPTGAARRTRRGPVPGNRRR